MPDLIKLLKITLLLDLGYKISHISVLSSEEMDYLVQGIQARDLVTKRYVFRLVYFMFVTDIESFDRSLDQATDELGIDTTIGHIILPFLEKTNLLAYNDDTIEIHFAVTSIRKKLMLGVETIKFEKALSESILLCLPENEHFDLILLFLLYDLKKAGRKVLYLGTDISINNLELAIAEKRPKYVCVYVADIKKAALQSYSNLVNRISLRTKIFMIYGEESIRSMLKKYDALQLCHYRLITSVISSGSI